MNATISDYLLQFAIIPNMSGNISGNKSSIYERYWSKFDQKKYILDQFSVNWDNLLKIHEINASNSTKMYLDRNNILLGTYALLKELINTN